MTMGKLGIHRLPVIKEGKVVNILSQSAVVMELAKLMLPIEDGGGDARHPGGEDPMLKEHFESISKMTIQNLGLSNKTDVLSVQREDSAVEAFRKIAAKLRQNLAVVESTETEQGGKLTRVVGSISSGDVRFLYESGDNENDINDTKRFNITVMEVTNSSQQDPFFYLSFFSMSIACYASLSLSLPMIYTKAIDEDGPKKSFVLPATFHITRGGENVQRYGSASTVRCPGYVLI
jgi:CBS domain-containing protein